MAKMLLLLRRRKSDRLVSPFAGILCSVTAFIFCLQFISMANAQRFSDTPPRYNYDSLPKTGFSCKGKFPGRYYPDPETDCQLFHVCVKMNNPDIQDFKFLCPNGTVFDSEHQVCMDYYQVVCHSDVGTNPLGQIFEIFKLSSGQGNRDLDATKLSLVNPDVIDRNTLGDDFQVEEYNNNRLASSQNAINFRASQPTPSPKPAKSNKAKEDIFFNNKGFSSNFGSYQEPRRTSTSTTTESPSSSTPRRPSLETFESYETESFSGFIPSRNSFGREPHQDPTQDFDASVEEFTQKDVANEFSRPTERSTTARPLVFQNTFRTTLSHLPSTSRPSAQTFQQQPTRFNDDYFTRLPSTTRRPVSKAAQFFLHSTTADDYFTPEYRQPTVNPFAHNQRPRSTTTTIRPNLVFQGNSGTVRPRFDARITTEFQYEKTTQTPSTTTTTTTTEFPSTTYRGQEDFQARQTTIYNSDFTRNSHFFSGNNNNNDKQIGDEFGLKPSASARQFPPQLSSQYVEEESLRPRNIHGVSNAQNSLHRQTPRNNFGFSTVPPPTTAEPASSTAAPSTASSTDVTHQETAQTLAVRLQGQLFKKITATKNPEKFSIFFGRSTQSVDDRLPSPGPTTVAYYDNSSTSRRPIRTRSTTANPFDFDVTTTPEYDRRGRLGRLGSISTTAAPDTASTSKPLRRGVRRRVVRPGRARQPAKAFDPQLKYTRRRVHKDALPRNDEIFKAEASVFRGDPALNYFQDQKKDGDDGAQKGNDNVEKPAQKQRNPVNTFEQFYGRRVRPGEANSFNNGSASVHTNNGEGARPPVAGPHLRRRVVKRIRPKTTTAEPGVSTDVNNATTPKRPFIVTGSTTRPVTRINVKTKLGGKISTTYRTTEITDGSSPISGLTESSTTTLATTEEPELVTASEDEIAEKRQHHHSLTSSQKPPFLGHRKQLRNDSHLVIKVLNEKPHPRLPLSLKKSILNSGEKKSVPSSKPGVISSSVGTKKSIVSSSSSTSGAEEESNTRSPDYDYAYYNSEDATDYDSETRKIDHKSFGKKPKQA